MEPEQAFVIGDVLVESGITLDTRELFAGDVVPPTLSDYQGLVVMGGSMAASSDEGFPTRRSEISLIAAAIEDGIPTLGVCLGAQLIAAACGARVYPGVAGQEIGWFPVSLGDSCEDDALFAGLPEVMTVLQWHGDTFDLPAGSELLVSNANYPNQAFRVGGATWGLQFHLEVTAEAVDGFISTFEKDAASAPGGVDRIRSETALSLEALRSSRDIVLRRFAALVGSSVDPSFVPLPESDLQPGVL
jgi:GMP synthase-like glutamine amidotransferase